MVPFTWNHLLQRAHNSQDVITSLGKGGYVFGNVCSSLTVSKIIRKVMNGSQWNLIGVGGVRGGTCEELKNEGSSLPVVSRWLWPGNRFLEMASMVVTWWIVDFLRSTTCWPGVQWIHSETMKGWCPHKPLRKIKATVCNHQADSQLYVIVWPDV